jgi:hemoglobin
MTNESTMKAPHPKAPGLALDIDEPMIRDLVHAFYAKVRLDPLLGPIFNARVADWDEHLAKLCEFWSSVTLLTGRYKGNPMVVHVALPDIAGLHFDRWLELFRETAAEICPPAAAALFIDRSLRIASSLTVGIAARRGAPGSLQRAV